MAIQTLIEQMQYGSQQNRQVVVDYILKNPQYFSEIITLAFDVNYKYHYKAAWIVLFVYKIHPEFLYPHLDFFTASLSQLKNEKAIRSLAKVCELLSKAYCCDSHTRIYSWFNPLNIDRIITVAFDWLIGNYSVAIKVYGMQILYNFGSLPQAEQWILVELKAILSESLYFEQKAFQARAKYLLKKIRDGQYQR